MIDLILENPYYALMEMGTPYEDYINKIPDTFNFKYYSKYLHEAKAINWDIDNSLIRMNQIRVIYASILELFIEDGIAESFYTIYSEYVDNVMSRNTSPLFRDGHMNSIFHYDAVQNICRTEAYETIQKLSNQISRKKIGIDTDVFDSSILSDLNTHGVSVADIIQANS